MQNLLWNRSAALLLGLAMLFVSSISRAGTPLNDWRSEIAPVRNLAKNDVPRAYKKAQRLQAAVPAGADTDDRFKTRIAMIG